MEEKISGCSIKCKIFVGIIIATVLFFMVPTIISFLVFNEKVLGSFPGTSEDWFGFWASYIGGIISIAIAAVTIYQTSIHEKEKEGMREDQKKLIDLMLNTNLRILETHIQISTQINNSDSNYYTSSTYSGEDPVQIEFKILVLNRAFSTLNKIILPNFRIKIGDYEENFTAKDSNEVMLLRQKDNVYMIIKCRMDKGSKIFHFFTAFYMQKGWFVPGAEICKLKLENVDIPILRYNKSEPKLYNMNLAVGSDGFTGGGERSFYIKTYKISSDSEMNS